MNVLTFYIYRRMNSFSLLTFFFYFIQLFDTFLFIQFRIQNILLPLSSLLSGIVIKIIDIVRVAVLQAANVSMNRFYSWSF